MSEQREMPADIAEAVKDNGHNLVFDGVRFERWTCLDCGRAVVRNELIHGSAVREACDKIKPYYRMGRTL